MPEVLPSPDQIYDPREQLIVHARKQLAHLYVSDEIVYQVRYAGLDVTGMRYFRELFSEKNNGMVPPETRLEDIYVGATAHGFPELARSARQLLVGNDPDDASFSQKVDSDLLFLVNDALHVERRGSTVSVERIKRLQSAAKELGESRKNLMMGSMATRLASSRSGRPGLL